MYIIYNIVKLRFAAIQDAGKIQTDIYGVTGSPSQINYKKTLAARDERGGLARRRRPRLGRRVRDLRQTHVDGRALVVQRGRLQDDAGGAHHHGEREDPQEQPVQHHRHVFPILFYLHSSNLLVKNLHLCICV